MKDFICIAHRGASGHAPENTLLAVDKALALGVSWIEVDVHLAEGELVVIHDPRLERTTNGTGAVSERPLAYIRSLDAGGGERIPLLAEVLDLVAGRAGVNIELKGENTAGPVAALVGARVARGCLCHDQVIVSCFDPDPLRAVRRCQPAIPIGLLMETIPRGYAQWAEQMGVYSIHVHRKAVVNEGVVAEAHTRGLKVFVYTVNDLDALRSMQRLGVDGIFTDYPELCTAG